jgi:hypothetical protein
MKILIWGDSYCRTDPDFPGLHWSEKILKYSSDFKINNLSQGGCSNAIIALQLMQGLSLEPDFVIFSFTNEYRYELDKDVDALPTDLSATGLANYQKNRYTTNCTVQDPELDRLMFKWTSGNFQKIKNYFYISLCLQTLEQKNIPFTFSLGGFEFQSSFGFEYNQDYTAVANNNYMYNFIKDYTDQKLETNLWYHGRKSKPCFHVDDESIQQQFADECISYINKLKDKNC